MARITEKLIDGMTITTGDVLGIIRVRAKAFGPGFCNVEYSTEGKIAAIFAPPLSYSAWHDLLEHIGKLTVKISENVKCDTGVEGEISYLE